VTEARFLPPIAFPSCSGSFSLRPLRLREGLPDNVSANMAVEEEKRFGDFCFKVCKVTNTSCTFRSAHAVQDVLHFFVIMFTRSKGVMCNTSLGHHGPIADSVAPHGLGA
jgi:hypothetical protein